MFVAAYDDRVLVPDYFAPFTKCVTKFCDLHLITPAVNLHRRASANSPFDCRKIPPSSLPQYQRICELFNDNFTNYSTNSESFERSCFHRWFALNAATNDLLGEDYICLLDTDFIIGMSPDKILSKCNSVAAQRRIQFIAEWNDEDPVTFGPEITIITKAFLHGFCEYLMTAYYTPGSKIKHRVTYYNAIGRGLTGGVSDMHALASYARPRSAEIFNLQNLHDPLIIGNFSSFLHNEIGLTNHWKIAYEQDGQVLHTQNGSNALIGVHFHGKAKPYMHLAGKNNGEITRDLCAAHITCKSTRVRRASYKFKNQINHLVNFVS